MLHTHGVGGSSPSASTTVSKNPAIARVLRDKKTACTILTRFFENYRLSLAEKRHTRKGAPLFRYAMASSSFVVPLLFTAPLVPYMSRISSSPYSLRLFRR